MPHDATAIAFGCAFAGALCIIGAISQVITGVTWGATGKGKVFRAEEPGYFWYMFSVRIILGPIAFIPGIIALMRK